MVLEVMFSGIGADTAVGDGEMAFTIVLWGRGRRKKGKGQKAPEHARSSTQAEETLTTVHLRMKGTNRSSGLNWTIGGLVWDHGKKWHRARFFFPTFVLPF